MDTKFKGSSPNRILYFVSGVCKFPIWCRCQEIEDPLYDTRAPPTQSSGQARIQASASKGNKSLLRFMKISYFVYVAIHRVRNLLCYGNVNSQTPDNHLSVLFLNRFAVNFRWLLQILKRERVARRAAWKGESVKVLFFVEGGKDIVK